MEQSEKAAAGGAKPEYFGPKPPYRAASAGWEEIKIQEIMMMQMTKIKRSLSLFLCTVLIAATALAVTGCSGKDDAAGGSGSSAAAGSSTAQVSSSAAQPGSSTAQTGGKVLGEGKTRLHLCGDRRGRQ